MLPTGSIRWRTVRSLSEAVDTIITADDDEYMIRCENLVKIYKTSFSKYGRAYCSFMEKTPVERSREIAAAGYMGWAAAAANQDKGYAGKGLAFGGRVTA